MEINTGNRLKGYIQREVRENNMHSNYGYNYYFCRSFLRRLFSNDSRSFILKGSLAQFSMLGTMTRPITDIDIVTSQGISYAKDVVEETLATSEGIKFVIKQKFVTTNSTINYRVMCSLDRVSHLIHFDLKKAEEETSTTHVMPKYFSLDEEFDVNTISLEEHLANKLYLVLLHFELNKRLGKEVRRLKDFFDIYTILSLGNFEIEKVYRLLEIRIKNDQFLVECDLRAIPLDKKFVNENQTRWNEESEKYGFNTDVSFEHTTKLATEFIHKHR